MNSKIFFAVLVSIILISIVSSLSEEAINASLQIEKSTNLTNSMAERGIPTARVNESLQETKQIYLGQLALEMSFKKYDYSMVLEKTQSINLIAETAFRAFDEFKVFNETYFEASKEIDISAMQGDYQKILTSFNEERFEETLTLIDAGYNKLSETQSKQTSVNLFYNTTSRTIKNFFKTNWIKILIIFIITLILFLIFRKALAKYIVHLKLNELTRRKQVLNDLIKKLQNDYFEKNIISQEEYTIKLSKFTEMLRDIAREVPLLKEEVMKLGDKSELNISPDRLIKDSVKIKRNRKRKRK